MSESSTFQHGYGHLDTSYWAEIIPDQILRYVPMFDTSIKLMSKIVILGGKTTNLIYCTEDDPWDFF